jgi:hypothetical protein
MSRACAATHNEGVTQRLVVNDIPALALNLERTSVREPFGGRFLACIAHPPRRKIFERCRLARNRRVNSQGV